MGPLGAEASAGGARKRKWLACVALSLAMGACLPPCESCGCASEDRTRAHALSTRGCFVPVESTLHMPLWYVISGRADWDTVAVAKLSQCDTLQCPQTPAPRAPFERRGGGPSPNTPTTGLRERGNDTSRSTGRSGRQNAATRRNMRREGRVTVQGPVKEQQPDGMCHRGSNPPPAVRSFWRRQRRREFFGPKLTKGAREKFGPITQRGGPGVVGSWCAPPPPRVVLSH